VKEALVLLFVVAVVFSGGPAIFLGAAVVGVIVWAVFWT
jgi:hypothetical protein